MTISYRYCDYFIACEPVRLVEHAAVNRGVVSSSLLGAATSRQGDVPKKRLLAVSFLLRLPLLFPKNLSAKPFLGALFMKDDVLPCPKGTQAFCVRR